MWNCPFGCVSLYIYIHVIVRAPGDFSSQVGHDFRAPNRKKRKNAKWLFKNFSSQVGHDFRAPNRKKRKNAKWLFKNFSSQVGHDFRAPNRKKRKSFNHLCCRKSCPNISLPEFMNFKLFGRAILVVQKSLTFFGPSTQPVRYCAWCA